MFGTIPTSSTDLSFATDIVSSSPIVNLITVMMGLLLGTSAILGYIKWIKEN